MSAVSGRLLSKTDIPVRSQDNRFRKGSTMSGTITTRLISGTFLGIDHFSEEEAPRFQTDIRSLTEDHWRQMIRDMYAIDIDTLVFQQCMTTRDREGAPRAYYNSPSRPGYAWQNGDTFGAVVDEATELGMTIYYGIGDMASSDVYLHTDEVMQDVEVTVKELAELYADLASFGGWYWTAEYSPASLAGRDTLQRTVPSIREWHDAPILIAPGADRGMCAAVLRDIDVDIIAYQDGVGLNITPKSWNRFPETNRFDSLARIPHLYRQIKDAHDAWQDPEDVQSYWNYYTRAGGRTAFWNDLEVWEFDHRGALIPAETSRVVSQLELSAPYVDKQIIFQYPGLMCHPDFPVKVGGERAVTLYEQYACYRQRILSGEL